MPVQRRGIGVLAQINFHVPWRTGEGLRDGRWHAAELVLPANFSLVCRRAGLHTGRVVLVAGTMVNQLIFRRQHRRRVRLAASSAP